MRPEAEYNLCRSCFVGFNSHLPQSLFLTFLCFPTSQTKWHLSSTITPLTTFAYLIVLDRWHLGCLFAERMENKKVFVFWGCMKCSSQKVLLKEQHHYKAFSEPIDWQAAILYAWLHLSCFPYTITHTYPLSLLGNQPTSPPPLPLSWHQFNQAHDTVEWSQ